MIIVESGAENVSRPLLEVRRRLGDVAAEPEGVDARDGSLDELAVAAVVPERG